MASFNAKDPQGSHLQIKTLVPLRFHPLNTSQWRLNFNMSFDDTLQTTQVYMDTF
jgi:hypothetical protein